MSEQEKDAAFWRELHRTGNLESFMDLNNEAPRQTTYVDTGTLVESYSRLQLIYGFSRALCSEAGWERLPEAALKALERLVNLERCFVAVKDHEGQMRPLAQHNIELPTNPAQWPVSKTIINRVMKDGLPIFIASTLQDNQIASRQSINFNRISTVMCVPLGRKDSCLGVIYADSRRLADSFSHADLLFLMTLAHYVYLGLSQSQDLAANLSITKSSTNLNSATSVSPEILIAEMKEFNIIGQAQPLIKAYERLRKVATKRVPILLLGETGTGKELFAAAAHKLNTQRRRNPLIAINIAALSETIVESELFGHEKGAFSGAINARPGRFELAQGGTLFLDEVAEIPLNIQAKLLRVLETGEFERVGGTKTLKADVRIVCATNRDLKEFVEKGQFREDLYYRLNGITVALPPLREHAEDIVKLVNHMLKSIGSEKSFSAQALLMLQTYPWPGNVRQLLRFVEEMDAISDAEQIDIGDLPEKMLANISEKVAIGDGKFLPLNEFVTRLEYQHIRQALELSGGNNDRAIEMLGISRAKFFDRKKVFGL